MIATPKLYKTTEAQRSRAKRNYDANRPARLIQCKKYREENKDTLNSPEKSRAKHLRKSYGITIEQHEALFVSQGSACAICRSKETAGLNWHTDHCHKRNVVRGVLCHNCNIMIGLAKEDTSILTSAISYLNIHSEGNHVH